MTHDGGTYNYRDAAIVVSPTKARSMVMYEDERTKRRRRGTRNGIAVSSAQTQTTAAAIIFMGRTHRQPPLQTELPQESWGELDVAATYPSHGHPGPANSIPIPVSAALSVGSPYSVKNFFAVNPLFWKYFVPGDDETAGRANALTEFQGFVSAADTAGINVMLDVPFNHTSFDCELDTYGQAFWGNVSPGTSLMENTEARILLALEWRRARIRQTAATITLGFRLRRARLLAPQAWLWRLDRYDFGKFVDVHDVYFGRYAALVYLNSGNNDTITRARGIGLITASGARVRMALETGISIQLPRSVWQYFAWYIPYWLQQTGHTDGSGNLPGTARCPIPWCAARPMTGAWTESARTLRRDCRHNSGSTS